MNRRALFIANPVARCLPSLDKLEAAVAWLASQGWDARLSLTGEKGHAADLSREAAASGYDVVFACGGDGTVNEVANGLAGSETALAVIRGGTANVWAKEIGVPREPLSAVRVAVEGKRRRVDLGVVEGEAAGETRAFLLMAGVGLDGHIVQRVPEGLKRRLGAAAYVAFGLRESLRFRPRPTLLLIDGEGYSVDLLWLLAANTRSYGGVIDVARGAVADDGMLDVYVFESRSAWQTFAHGLRILARRQSTSAAVTHAKAARIEISSPVELECQVDGESLDFAPRLIRVEAGALAVMVPSEYDGPLFSVAS